MNMAGRLLSQNRTFVRKYSVSFDPKTAFTPEGHGSSPGK